MGRKGIKLHEGDVFRFLDENKGCGLGQIIIKNINEYIIVFDKVFLEDELCFKNIDKLRPIFGGWTSDGRIYSGDWKVIGNSSYRPTYEFPEFKVLYKDQYWLTDVFGDMIRPATEHEVTTLDNRFNMSPIAYEKAFWAWHNDGEWEERFNKILIGN